jgi:beta-glucosidase
MKTKTTTLTTLAMPAALAQTTRENKFPSMIMIRSKLLSLVVVIAIASALQTRRVEAQPPPAPPAAPKHAVTPAPRIEQWWFARHAEKIGEMSTRDINLLMIGDSITHSYDGAGSNVWKRSFEPRKAINLGFGGDRTQHVLWRLDHLPEMKELPKGAVVLIGWNNVGWGSDTPRQAAEGVQAAVRKVRALYQETKILVLAVLPRRAEPTHKFRKQINELNSYLPELLKDLICAVNIGRTRWESMW